MSKLQEPFRYDYVGSFLSPEECKESEQHNITMEQD